MKLTVDLNVVDGVASRVDDGLHHGGVAGWKRERPRLVSTHLILDAAVPGFWTKANRISKIVFKNESVNILKFSIPKQIRINGLLLVVEMSAVRVGEIEGRDSASQWVEVLEAAIWRTDENKMILRSFFKHLSNRVFL